MPRLLFALAALTLLWIPGTGAVAEVSDQSGIIEEMVVPPGAEPPTAEAGSPA